MSGHGTLKCSKCGKIIAQCRCFEAYKNVEYTICDECKKVDVSNAFRGEVKKGPMDSGRKVELFKKMQEILNQTCSENASNTPDFILAKYLITCLEAFNEAVVRRDDWYNVNLEPTNSYFIPKESDEEYQIRTENISSSYTNKQ